MVTRSMFGASLFVAAMAFAGDVRQLFALRAAQGLFSGTVPASRLLAASIVPSDRLGQTMGLMGTAQFVGSSFAPLVGGLVAESLLAGFPSGSRGSGVVASRGNGEMAIDRRVTTAEELLRLPDDGIRRELIDGELRTMSPTGAGHGEHESAITFHIGTYLASNPVARMWGGEVGFLLRRNPDRVRAPDIAIMRRQRVPPAGFFEGAPDLAIEIVSPGDAADDVEEKVQEWLAAGAETVWVVYPTGPRLAVRRPDGSAQTYGPDDDVDGGPMLPGFRMRLSALLTPPGF
jgi:Uma2 family endonuclease